MKKQTQLQYPDKKMYQMIEDSFLRYPDDNAYIFKGRKTSYRKMLEKINKAAKAFVKAGIKKGDVVMLCMPNIPQAIDCFYAVNRTGAAAAFIHPLSAEKEIADYIRISECSMIIVSDLFYEKTKKAALQTNPDIRILVARIQNELPFHLSLLYNIKKGKDYLHLPDRKNDILWRDFVDTDDNIQLPEITYNENDTAVILFSGGTTGVPKGIMLSDLNFNALVIQAREAMECSFERGLKNLSAMPVFHGFGLGIGIHMPLSYSACCVLMPTVDTASYVRELLKEKPNFIAGVPTIFRMLIESDKLEGKDLSFLKGMYAGGDALPVKLKREVDNFLIEHNASIQVREGYGLTECVTASCLTPSDSYREGSIGIPFPDTLYKIVSPGTDKALPFGEEGEIVISGKTVMQGYLKNEEETKNALKVHSDGRKWLHTGDLGVMDKDGYVYFRQRMKRVIISSGYNIYPSQVEHAIEENKAVDYCCVIGVPDEFRIEKVKAFIVLKKGITPCEETKKLILDTCREYIAPYAIPKEIEFRTELPKTLVGKVAYRLLESQPNPA